MVAALSTKGFWGLAARRHALHTGLVNHVSLNAVSHLRSDRGWGSWLGIVSQWQGNLRQQSLHRMTLATSWTSEKLRTAVRLLCSHRLEVHLNPTGQLCMLPLLWQRPRGFTLVYAFKVLSTDTMGDHCLSAASFPC